MTTYLNSNNIGIKMFMIENSNVAGIAHYCLIPKNSTTTVKYPLVLSGIISYITFNNLFGID